LHGEDDIINLTIENKWSIYTITDINTVTLEKTVDLDYPFTLDKYQVSPNGQFIILGNGKIYDISGATPDIHTPFINNIYSTVLISNNYALVVDSSGWSIYNLNTRMITESGIVCNGTAPKAITNDGKILIAKSSQQGLQVDLIN